MATTTPLANDEGAMHTNECNEMTAKTPDRTRVGTGTSLLSPGSTHEMQRMKESVEELDRTVSSVNVSAHDAEHLSLFVHNVSNAAKYYSWDLERKQSVAEHLPLLTGNIGGSSSFQIRCVNESDGVYDHDFLGLPPAGHQPGRVFFNSYGRLRHAKLQPFRNLVSDGSDGNCDGWEKTAREAFEIIDTNKDGFLSRKEMLLAVKHMSEINNDFALNVNPNSEDMMKSLLHRTEDEKIDIAEFMSIVQIGISSGHNVIRANLTRASKFIHDLLLNERQQLVPDRKGQWVCVINPTRRFYLFWNLCVTLATVALVFFLPVSFGWEEWSVVYHCNFYFEGVFCLDFILSLVTGYIDEDGEVILERNITRKEYYTGTFLVDLLSSIPAHSINEAWGKLRDGPSGQYLFLRTFLKSLKLLRLAKLFVLRRTDPLHVLTKRLSAFLENKSCFTIPVVVVKLLRLGLLTFVLSHWMGSLQWLLVKRAEFPQDSWAAFTGLENESIATQWRYAIFKALSQLILIGFESSPFTSTACETLSQWCQTEHWITLLCLYIGAGYYSFLISSMLAVIQANNVVSTSYQDRLSLLTEYLKRKELPLELRCQIRENFRINNPQRVFFDEDEIAKSMSIQHIEAIRRHRANELASIVPILAHPDHKVFSHCVTGHLTQVKIDAGQILFKEGEIGDAIYFVEDGYMRLTAAFFHETDHRQTILAAGCFFGEVSLLSESMLRTMTATAFSKCTLFRLEHKAFQEILRRFPDAADRVKIAADRRFRVLMNFKNSRNPLPSGCGVTASLSSFLDPEDKIIPSVANSERKIQDISSDDEDTSSFLSQDDPSKYSNGVIRVSE